MQEDKVPHRREEPPEERSLLGVELGGELRGLLIGTGDPPTERELEEVLEKLQALLGPQETKTPIRDAFDSAVCSATGMPHKEMTAFIAGAVLGSRHPAFISCLVQAIADEHLAACDCGEDHYRTTLPRLADKIEACFPRWRDGQWTPS